MGEKNGHYCVDGEMWDIDEDGYPTLVSGVSAVNVCKAFLELFRDSDMRPEDECHVLYDAAEMAVAKESTGELAALRARVEKLEKYAQHSDECELVDRRGAHVPYCTCGLTAALAECEEVDRG